MSTCNAPRDGWERGRGTDHLAKLVGRHVEDEMLRVAPLFVQKIDCVCLTKLVLLSLVVAALMPRGKLESCDGLVVLRCSEKSSSTSKMPRLHRVEPCAPGPLY